MDGVGMTEIEWLGCADPDEMLGWVSWGKDPDRKRFLFLLACIRPLAPYLRDQRLKRAGEVLEEMADGIRNYNALLDAFQDASAAWEELHEDASEQRWFHGHLAAAESVVAALHPESYEDLNRPMERCCHAIELLRSDRDQPLIRQQVRAQQTGFVRDIFGNLFRPASLDLAHRTPTVVSLAHAAYNERQLPSGELDPVRLSILADALEETGSPGELVAHLRGPGPHVRGCFAVDLCLGRR